MTLDKEFGISDWTGKYPMHGDQIDPGGLDDKIYILEKLIFKIGVQGVRPVLPESQKS